MPARKKEVNIKIPLYTSKTGCNCGPFLWQAGAQGHDKILQHNYTSAESALVKLIHKPKEGRLSGFVSPTIKDS